MPALVGLLSSLVLPELDAVSDWLVTLDFYEGGDMGWFKASLTILLLSGGLATLLLRAVFADYGAKSCRSIGKKGTCGGWLLLLAICLTICRRLSCSSGLGFGGRCAAVHA